MVKKRCGSLEPVSFDKILERLTALATMPPTLDVCVASVAQKVINGLYDGVSTEELDRLAAETAAYSSTLHPDYDSLAARIEISNLHKNTSSRFSAYVESLPADLLSSRLQTIVGEHHEKLDAAIVHERDFDFSYFAVKTLMRSYLIRDTDKVLRERPQYMWMRVAVGIHEADMQNVLKTYDLLSRKQFIHATPTLFNAGTPRPQCSSCFLMTMKEDSIEGIYDTLKRCACISKYAGGIGLSIHNVRAKDSYIRGTNGTSNGIIPMLRVFNNTSRYVDQGGGKRKGSIAIYIEPWHADIYDFLNLKKNHGKEEARARDLFYALWISDLFMKRVKQDTTWSLFCPNEAPGLADCHGDAFEELYERYEREGRARKTISAQKLWYAVLEAQIETGTPYMLYKDAANAKSNQCHLGTIKSSNLCTEIIEYTAPDETAVCNLASINLAAFATAGEPYDFDGLVALSGTITLNLNRIIDLNFYPIESARRSNFRHRPIGIGVQGLADVFAILRHPWDSPEARELNRRIFEAIYFGALDMSCRLAEEQGPYESYEGSPMSKGKLQCDLWEPGAAVSPTPRVEHFAWDELRERIAKFGVRNSLLTAPMPTATTSQILGNNECFEPHTSNMYTRRTNAGEFTVINKHLVRDLIGCGLWDDAMRKKLIRHEGSVQDIPEIPEEIRAIHKTVWEIKQRTIIDMAVDRGPFICQSQSMNIHVAEPTFARLTSMHFYTWKKGLKTGMYYLRTKPRATPIKELGCDMCGS